MADKYRILKRRKKKTTDEQYEIYLKTMEDDYYLRNSVTVNPSGDNYVEEQWLLLTEKLNSVENGPRLTVEQWKKRFQDWKNAARAKYRKMQEHNNSKDGTKCYIRLTSMDKRGLAIWGHVAGANNYNNVGEPGADAEENVLEENVSPSTIEMYNNSCQTFLPPQEDVSPISDDHNYIKVDPLQIPTSPTIPNSPESDLPIQQPVRITLNQKKKKPQPKDLNGFPTKLLKYHFVTSKSNEKLVNAIEKFTTIYTKTENRKLKQQEEIEYKRIKIEEMKIKFEIEKFKFQNPGFSFNT